MFERAYLCELIPVHEPEDFRSQSLGEVGSLMISVLSSISSLSISNANTAAMPILPHSEGRSHSRDKTVAPQTRTTNLR